MEDLKNIMKMPGPYKINVPKSGPAYRWQDLAFQIGEKVGLPGKMMLRLKTMYDERIYDWILARIDDQSNPRAFVLSLFKIKYK